MTNLKVWMSLVLALIMAFSMTACATDQGNNNPTDASKDTTATESVETESTEASTEEPTEEPIEEPTEEPTEEYVNPLHNDLGTVVYTLNCDTADGWVTDVGAGVYGPFLNVGAVDTENKREGEGSLYINCDKTAEIGAFLGPSAVFQWTGAPIDTGLERENAAIRLCIYVSNPYVVNMASKIQIGSAGMPDVDNYEFIFGNSADETVCTHAQILEAGWNEITLNLSDAWKVGNPDLSAINFIKFYALIVPEGCEVRIDNIRIVNLEG